MHRQLRHAERGQAITETVIFLPMFLIALFGMIWAIQAAVQSERVESAVRYAGLVSQHANPYTDYSLYTMYTQLGSTTVPAVACIVPLTDALSYAAPTYTSSQTTTASPPFWNPTTPTSSCTAPGLVGWPAGTSLVQDVILSQQNPSVTTTINIPSQLVSAFGGASTTSMTATDDFFKPVGVNTILACYPSLNTQVTLSLQYQTDTSTAVTPSALTSVTAITPAPLSTCVSH